MKSRAIFVLIFLIAIVLIIISLVTMRSESKKTLFNGRDLITQSGVCPPFNLYDEDGNVIDPINNINSEKPYSPKQTCGKCHDYDKITQGFHFQQGKDETATGTLAERYQWVSNPGNYGGNWCSPAPLYNYLCKKHNYIGKGNGYDFLYLYHQRVCNLSSGRRYRLNSTGRDSGTINIWIHLDILQAEQ